MVAAGLAGVVVSFYARLIAIMTDANHPTGVGRSLVRPDSYRRSCKALNMYCTDIYAYSDERSEYWHAHSSRITP